MHTEMKIPQTEPFKQYTATFTLGNTAFEIFLDHSFLGGNARLPEENGVHNHFFNELLFTTGGELRFFAGERQYDIAQNELIYFPKLFSHATQYTHCKKYYTVGFLFKKLSNKNQTENTYSLFREIFASEVFCVFLSKTCLDIVTHIVEQIAIGNALSYYYVVSLLQQFFLELGGCVNKAAQKQNERATVGDLKFLLCNRINQFEEKITLKQLSQEFFVSERQLRRIIREIFGTSLSKRRSALRIENAKRLLTTTDLSVESIAQKCYFCDGAAFIAAFKKSEGVSPTAYREQNENGKKTKSTAYTLLPFESEDYGKLTDFMRPLWLRTYQEILPEAQIEFLVKKYFTPQAVERFLQEGYEYYKWQDEQGRTAGVLVFVEKEDHTFMDKLYLLPQARGCGLPAQAFAFLAKRGKDILLSVNRANARAYHAYLKNGFTVQREVEVVLENGMVNLDYVMKKRV